MAVVAKEFGWERATFEAMTFHELVMLWYPKAVSMRQVRQSDMTSAILTALSLGFGNGQRN